MEEADTRLSSSNILSTVSRNVMKQLFILIFLFDTGSFEDSARYQKLKSEYEILSKKINKFTQWVEENWNENQ